MLQLNISIHCSKAGSNGVEVELVDTSVARLTITEENRSDVVLETCFTKFTPEQKAGQEKASLMLTWLAG